MFLCTCNNNLKRYHDGVLTFVVYVTQRLTSGLFPAASVHFLVLCGRGYALLCQSSAKDTVRP